MYDQAPLLLQIPPARLFDEVLKLFMSGHGLVTFRMLSHYGLFGMLFPEAEEAMADAAWAEELIEQALTNTDKRIAEERPVTPAFLLAAFCGRRLNNARKSWSKRACRLFLPCKPPLSKWSLVS